MKQRPLLSPMSVHAFTYEQFAAYTSSLVIHPPTKASRTVPDVTISQTKKSIIIRFRREKKQVSEKELEALQLEHPKLELRNEFTKRKIAILDEEGKQTNEWNNSSPRKRRTKKALNEGDAQL